MSVVYLSLGSNLGDRRGNLDACLSHLGAIGDITKVSSLYETEPVEIRDQPWFLNCAVELATELTPQELLAAVKRIEEDMGRRRTIPKGPRTIDIDILLYGDQIIDEPGLKVPHPAMHQRRFVLAPLAEIDAEVIHPVRERSVGELLDELPADAGKVRKMES
ncbi:MAG TPA: 2-amino-4-hydroxy-6-hydroxymethyldihydropteridine diphosphokinase [Terriglobales bacterium]|nr:2-amino-4-hydroxy-6-hydroxymethyldihydropteridine diphosphokinase [Terriglobales bacterium]